MKKSKKFILSILVILIIAVTLLLAFPGLFERGKEEVAEAESTEIQTELGDEIFD
ncbi:MAG: competence protein ComGC [Urechidicola sp.]|jgi:competence protein ComGC|tara:strand:+ start:2205 stop:2369 length:165 start_codon:yes stop_codon:yes gene_type:complete